MKCQCTQFHKANTIEYKEIGKSKNNFWEFQVVPLSIHRLPSQK
jgi:hypothetical protein